MKNNRILLLCSLLHNYKIPPGPLFFFSNIPLLSSFSALPTPTPSLSFHTLLVPRDYIAILVIRADSSSYSSLYPQQLTQWILIKLAQFYSLKDQISNLYFYPLYPDIFTQLLVIYLSFTASHLKQCIQEAEHIEVIIKLCIIDDSSCWNK